MISQIDFDHALRITAEILLSNWTWTVRPTQYHDQWVACGEDCGRL
jgi:hypothetical protein